MARTGRARKGHLGGWVPEPSSIKVHNLEEPEKQIEKFRRGGRVLRWGRRQTPGAWGARGAGGVLGAGGAADARGAGGTRRAGGAGVAGDALGAGGALGARCALGAGGAGVQWVQGCGVRGAAARAPTLRRAVGPAVREQRDGECAAPGPPPPPAPPAPRTAGSGPRRGSTPAARAPPPPGSASAASRAGAGSGSRGSAPPARASPSCLPPGTRCPRTMGSGALRFRQARAPRPSRTQVRFSSVLAAVPRPAGPGPASSRLCLLLPLLGLVSKAGEPARFQASLECCYHVVQLKDVPVRFENIPVTALFVRWACIRPCSVKSK